MKHIRRTGKYNQLTVFVMFALKQAQKVVIFVLHDTVVVEKEAFESRQVGEVVDLSDLIVGELDRVELVQRRAQVLDRRDFVT